jgi:hypothetical protein
VTDFLLASASSINTPYQQLAVVVNMAVDVTVVCSSPYARFLFFALPR